MSRPTFGQRARGRAIESVLDPRLAIVRQCPDPQLTTSDRLSGRPTPCYRCLAFTDACHFTTREERTA